MTPAYPRPPPGHLLRDGRLHFLHTVLLITETLCDVHVACS